MSKGVTLVSNGRCSRTLIGLFGKIEFSRTVLIPADITSLNKLIALNGGKNKNIYPVDIALQLDKLPFKITADMICEIALIATKSASYEVASSGIKKIYGISISPNQVKNITDYVGQQVLKKQRQIADLAMRGQYNLMGDMLCHINEEESKDTLFIFIDGAMVHIRDKEVYEKRKKKIEDAWIESKHALAIHSSNITIQTTESGNEEHEFSKKEYVGYIGTINEFKWHLNALVWRNGGFLQRRVVVISDGAAWIHNWAVDTFPAATYILDLFHAKETAGKFAKSVKRGKRKKEEFADELCELIENGKLDELFALLKNYKDKKMPEGVPNLYTCIKNHADGMDYPSYIANGFFVGSGAIESGNRQVMQNRLKLPGMRWNHEEAQQMLSLKAKCESGQWDDVEFEVYSDIYGEEAAKAVIQMKRETRKKNGEKVEPHYKFYT